MRLETMISMPRVSARVASRDVHRKQDSLARPFFAAFGAKRSNGAAFSEFPELGTKNHVHWAPPLLTHVRVQVDGCVGPPSAG